MRLLPLRRTGQRCIGILGLMFGLGIATSAQANVYPTNVRINGGLTNVALPLGGTNVTISYLLNEPASAGVIISVKASNTLVRTITLAGGGAGTIQGSNAVVWNGKDNASNGITSGNYSISVTAATPGYDDWTQISDDFNANSYVFRPRGIAVNRNPVSPFYGRIFVGNAAPGFNPGLVPGDTLGMQKFNSDGSSAADGVFSSGGWPWAGNLVSPWKIEVSEDDYIYVNDWSSNGVVLRFDQAIATNSQSLALRNDNWPNGGTSRLSGPGLTGSGTNAQIWMADVTSPGGTGIVRWSVSPNGVTATNDVGTRVVQAGAGSDLGFAPCDVAVDRSNRVYTIQFRTNSADPNFRVLRFSATNVTPATVADWKIGNGDDDMRGASGIAVNSTASMVAVAFVGVGSGVSRVSGAVRVFNATNGTDLATLTPAPHHDHTDVAWDNVGNLYTCDNWDSLWRIYSPPGSNAATTVAIASVQVVLPTPPVLSAPLSTNGQFQFTLTGQANVTYVIQSSTNLQDWVSVVTNSQSPAVRTILLSAPASQSFYRAFAP